MFGRLESGETALLLAALAVGVALLARLLPPPRLESGVTARLLAALVVGVAMLTCLPPPARFRLVLCRQGVS